MMSGIGSTIAQGMAFGTGSAIAHRAVGAVAGAVTGGGSEEPAQHYEAPAVQQGQMPSSASDACQIDKQNFFECLKMNNGDAQSCQFLYDAMKQCQTGAQQQQTTWN